MSHVSLIVILVGLLVSSASTARAQSEAGTVTAAISGVFAGPTPVAGISVDGLTVGTGAILNSDGTATGTFYAVLAGVSAAGMPHHITVDGSVAAGRLAGGGQAELAGTAQLDLGDGTHPLPAVPFSVIATADTLLVTIDATPLSAAAITKGAIAIE